MVYNLKKSIMNPYVCTKSNNMLTPIFKTIKRLIFDICVCHYKMHLKAEMKNIILEIETARHFKPVRFRYNELETPGKLIENCFR